LERGTATLILNTLASDETLLLCYTSTVVSWSVWFRRHILQGKTDHLFWMT